MSRESCPEETHLGRPNAYACLPGSYITNIHSSSCSCLMSGLFDASTLSESGTSRSAAHLVTLCREVLAEQKNREHGREGDLLGSHISTLPKLPPSTTSWSFVASHDDTISSYDASCNRSILLSSPSPSEITRRHKEARYPSLVSKLR